jgi:general stress protein 26
MTDTHHEQPHAGSDEIEKVRTLVKDERIAMLTTVAEDGSLVSRPMGVQAVDFDGDLWFFDAADSHKVAEIARDSAANAAFSGTSSWVSLSGRATLVHDPDKFRELWNAVADAWFPDGPDTPGVVLIRLHAESAAYGRPGALRHHVDDLLSAAGRAGELADPTAVVGTQGETLTVRDFLDAYVLEWTVHHLDLVAHLPAAAGPPEATLAASRTLLEALLGAPVPPSLADADAPRVVTGRRAPTDAERAALRPLAARLPLSLG